MDFIYEPERIIIKNEENKIVGEIDFTNIYDISYQLYDRWLIFYGL